MYEFTGMLCLLLGGESALTYFEHASVLVLQMVAANTKWSGCTHADIPSLSALVCLADRIGLIHVALFLRKCSSRFVSMET